MFSRAAPPKLLFFSLLLALAGCGPALEDPEDSEPDEEELLELSCSECTLTACVQKKKCSGQTCDGVLACIEEQQAPDGTRYEAERQNIAYACADFFSAHDDWAVVYECATQRCDCDDR